MVSGLRPGSTGLLNVFAVSAQQVVQQGVPCVARHASPAVCVCSCTRLELAWCCCKVARLHACVSHAAPRLRYWLAFVVSAFGRALAWCLLTSWGVAAQ